MRVWIAALSVSILLCSALPSKASTTSPKASDVATDLSDCSRIQVTTTNFPVFDSGWLGQSHWTVLVDGAVQTLEAGNIKQSLSPHQLILKMTAIPPVLASACSAADLTAVKAALKKVQVIVLFDGKQLSAAAPPAGDPLVSVTGSISPDVTSPAQYTLDSSGEFAWSTRSRNFSFGPVGTMKADSRQGVDPDSITLSGLFQQVLSRSRGTDEGVRKAFLGSQLNLFAPGIETSRKDTTRNLITGFAYVQAIRMRSQLKSESRLFPSLLVGLGMEGGKNFKSLSTPASGLGAIARGYGSVDLQATFVPTHSHNQSPIPYLKSIVLASRYRVRVPAFAESYTYAVDKTDHPYLATKAAHYVKSELDFNITDDFSISTIHEYGFLPPVFRLIDHKVSIGFKYSIKSSSHAPVGSTSL